MPFPFGFAPDSDQPYDLSDAEMSANSGAVPMRTVGFEYLQRDGGDIEGLGAGIEPYAFVCFYTGENYDTRLRGLRDSIQRQPKGLLTHPQFGPVRAHCLGVDDYSVDYVRERDTVNFRISFKRDATDTTSIGSQVPSVSSAAARLQQTLATASRTVSVVAAQAKAQIASISDSATAILLFPTTVNAALGTVTAEMDNLVAVGTAFINAAVLASTLGIVDFTLTTQRGAVLSGCESVTDQLRATGFPDPTLYPALAQVQAIYAQALEIDTLVRTQGPQVETIRVPGRQPIVVFSAQQYGGAAAIGKVDELRINNHVGSFGINPGQQMRVIGPTARTDN